MATTNPVFQVLTTSGNQAPLAAGSRVNSLQHGQIGIFNYHTGLSVDGTVLGDSRDIFIAVGINRASGSGAMDDLLTSAGDVLQVRHLRAFTVKGTVNEVQKVVEFTGFKANCESDYRLKIEFRNQKSYAMNGYNQFAKTYGYFTGCCADPCTNGCGTGDPVELAFGLAADINADTDALVVAAVFGNKIVATINVAPTSDANTTVTIGSTVYVVPVLDADTTAQVATKIANFVNAATGTPYKVVATGSDLAIYSVATGQGSTATFAVTGAGVGANAIVSSTKTVITDQAAFKAAFPGVSVGLRITGVPQLRPSFNGDINIKYYKNGTDFIVTPVEGFACNGTVTEVTLLQYNEGNGYDLKQEEYVAGGWNGKPGPYRQSDITGLARQGFESFVNVGSNYNIIALAYDQESVGGWLEYKNNLETTIAIPCADTTTLTGLVTMLDAIFTQSQPMSNDVASMNCSNSRTGLLTPATDGVESLS
jgi:hypothetical protein